MKCQLLQGLFLAFMLGQAVAMIMVNTGGVHDTNKFSSESTAPASAPATTTASGTTTTTTGGITPADISSLLSILGPLLTSLNALPSTGLSATPFNIQSPAPFGWPGTTRFGGGLGGGSSLTPNLFAPSTSNLRDITDLVTTIYTVNNNNNARFNQVLPQYNPYEYREYYTPPVVQYTPQKFLYDQTMFPNYQLNFR
ncbi:uncharacterized protein LOC109614463 [Musca domestica]|uniref:Uncharacterized protein LOC109614463 n=1 Tax=Musca domestica TaxID=7370 RepID=A0A9J7DK92_MUSDO|nr:uncharacterized protein LOC109614463 [Musca domestica]